MKRIVLIISILVVLCGCNNEENSLIKNNYLEHKNYNTVFNDLKKVVNDIAYIPSKETEKKFYEMIEIISDNCDYFTKDELSNLYQLVNNDYKFEYSNNRYTNLDYQNDLSKIKTCFEE